MSNLLNEAIVDAQALREAALKNAESAVVDKYSDEVRQTLEKLLEQDDLDLGLEDIPTSDEPGLGEPAETDPLAAEPAEAETSEDIVDDVPLAATDNLSDMDGTNLGGFPTAGEAVDVTIDLQALQEAVKELASELDEGAQEEIVDEELEFTNEDLEKLVQNENDTIDEDAAGDAYVDADEEGAASGVETSAQSEEDEHLLSQMEEEVDLDSLVDDIVERLTVDMGATLSGWAGRSSESMKYEMEREIAHRRSTDVAEELDALKKAQEELVFENKQLKARTEQSTKTIETLRENLQDINLSNAKLLYTNRVLRNTSLNERQKNKIAEAISKAGSVAEAKTIHQTLESAAPATPKRNVQQSLSETIARRSSVIRASRQESTSSDPLADRMKKLAGIK